MKCLLILYFIIIISFSENASCQKENYNWMLGDTFGLSFNTSDLYPKLIEKPINIPMGMLYDKIFEKDYLYYKNATISDSTGNYLFNSFNGVNIWEKNNNLIYNYNDAGWDTSYSSFPFLYTSAIWMEGSNFIVQQPGNPNLYYNFFIRPIKNLWLLPYWDDQKASFSVFYHILDKGKDSDNGSLIKSKIQIGDFASYNLPVRHHNKEDIWILVFKYDISLINRPFSFINSYLLTKDGLDTMRYVINTFDINDCIGYDRFWYRNVYYETKVNSQSNLLAMNCTDDTLRLFDFDNKTGIIKKIKKLKINNVNNISFEFSPDGSKIYTLLDSIINNKYYLILSQIDLNKNCQVEMIDTFLVDYGMYEGRGLSNGRNLLQIAPGGRIYGLHHSIYDSLSLREKFSIVNSEIFVIDHPNEIGKECHLKRNFMRFISRESTSSFLNKFAAFPISLKDDINPVIYAQADRTFCGGDTISLTSQLSDTVINVNYLWTGPNGFKSTKQNPVIPGAIPEMSGKYIVYFEYYGYTGRDTVDVKVNPPPLVKILGDTAICPGENAVLFIDKPCNGCTYQWSTGAKKLDVKINKGGSYWVNVTDANGCTNSDSIYVTENQMPSVKINPLGATSFCIGDSVVLRATPDSLDFVWSTGDKAKSIIVKQTGKYSIIGTNNTGCRGYDTIEVTVSSNLKPKIIFEGDDPACDGDSINLSSSLTGSGYDYTWSNGETSESIIVSQSGIYTLKVSTGGSCEGMDSIYVSINPNPVVKILGSSSICNGESSVLSSDKDYPSYLWSTGETTKSIIIKNAGQYWLEAINEFGCTARDTIEVTEIETKLDIPESLTFDSLCFGGSQARDIEIKNAGNTGISIDGISISGQGFRLDKPFQPFILDSGASMPIKLLFIPETPGNNSGELIIYSASPCALRDTVQLNAYSKPVIQVRAGEASGYPGDKACIPVYGRLSGNSPEPMGLDYSLSMAFPLKSFMPESPDEGIISGDKRIVNLSGSGIFTSQETSLGEVCGRIMLYPDSIVSVDINDFSTEEYVTCNNFVPGMIRIFPVCAEGTRLIELIDKPVLIISPNPVRDELIFTIKGNRELPASYIIRDMLGREVTADLIVSGPIEISSLATGLYMIQFSFRDGAILNYRFMKE